MSENFSYDPQRDVYVDARGHTYIRNEFDPNDLQYIDISGSTWTGVRNGLQEQIDWSQFSNIKSTMLDAVQALLKAKLKYRSVFYIRQVRLALTALDYLAETEGWDSWGSISIHGWSKIWSQFNRSYKSSLRAIYSDLARQRIDGANITIATELSRWKSRNGLIHLKGVRTWDPNSGSLTSAEIELLRQAIRTPLNNASPKLLVGRLGAWCAMETIKRSSQITNMKKDALKEIGNQSFLEIPSVKGQTGESKLWPISKELACEIKKNSKIKKINQLQKKYDRLLVIDCPSLTERGSVSSAELKNHMKAYIQTLNILSPRTDKKLNVTPLRLRHTGGTKFAEHGFSRDIICEILEHDSYGSADAYIDAVGSDLIPAIERSDRKLGTLFRGLSNVFFKGKIVKEDELKNHPNIYIPIFEEAPALVGSCGRDSIKDGKCSRHPFMGCYDDCPSFLAWADADHAKALSYVESEYERWSQATGHKERWKARTEFERTHKAIQEVISEIDSRQGAT